MKKKKMFWGAIVLLVLIVFAYWLKGYIVIDNCLDSGGRWNYDKGVCEWTN